MVLLVLFGRNYVVIFILVSFFLLVYSTLYSEILTTLTKNPPINRITNRLAFKIKHAYKLELQTLESMELLDSTKKIMEKAKNMPNFLK